MRLAPPPPHRAALAVHAAFLVHLAALAGLVIFEATRGERLARRLALLGADASGRQALVGDVTLFAVLLLTVAATAVIAACAYLTWLVRARRASVPGVRGSGGVLAGWLVPGLNLIVPPLLVDRVWRETRGRLPAARRRRWLALLAAWWLAWLGALASIGAGFAARGGVTGVGLVQLAAFSLAALLCTATIRQIARTRPAGPRPGRFAPYAEAGHDARVIDLPPLGGPVLQPQSAGDQASG
ncbi:DUF4328 domain-containing protein [Spongiactinospora sp. 9N601]|uniref:DUF4328 domain-containing protein n=1 Tax=Spongiactinospora sp. 9N601 TaxID=3375149 RepID=UPI00378B21A7